MEDNARQCLPNVVIWGAGKKCKIVVSAIYKDKCTLKGIADSNMQLHQSKYMNQWIIDAPEKLIDESIDYIIVSPEFSETILEQCREMGIEKSKVIVYWESDIEYDFIDSNVKKIYELENELKKIKIRLNNLPYELGLKPEPMIRSAEELLETIIKEKKSLSRYGDGELEIMQNRVRPWFQETDKKLAERLKEIFNCKDQRIIIALANDFGNLDCFTEESADAIRQYLSEGIREKVMQMIDLNRTYYDAYVSRPYIQYQDKHYADRIFTLFKKIWENRDVLLVEGRYAYNGIRNDLFQEAASIRRIIAPAKNAFSMYDEILTAAEKCAEKDTLVLISLGPTATVLAYDLAMKGIQALDIGQLDNEYEWYMRGTDKKTKIPGKCVAESVGYRIPDEIEDRLYEQQIIARIEGKDTAPPEKID